MTSNLTSFMGASLDEEDITAAASIEGGRCLIGWLAQQECHLGEELSPAFGLDKDEIPVCVPFEVYSCFFGH